MNAFMLPPRFTYNPLWNIFLLTSGSVLYSLGAKGIILYHNFITGGVFGLGFLFYYAFDFLSPGVWFLLFNIPIFIIGLFFISRRFFWYSIYSMLLITLSYEFISFDFGIKQQLHAAIAGGVICGVGSGLILRSLGSGGGLDIIAIILNKKFNIGLGRFFFAFNIVLFGFSSFFIDIDMIISSMILVYFSSATLEYVLSMFNQRKMVLIISDQNQEISTNIIQGLQYRATLIKAKGAYTGDDRDILMTITNNIQLKRLEELVFTIDPKALFIVEDTFSVIGSTFGERKVY